MLIGGLGRRERLGVAVVARVLSAVGRRRAFLCLPMGCRPVRAALTKAVLIGLATGVVVGFAVALVLFC